MKFLRSEVDRTFEAFSMILYRKECWEYVFLRMRWANQDNTKTHDFFKANTKDFQPNNHLAIFKKSPSCTSLNKHIILKKKHKFHSFHVCFRWCILPHLVFSKKMRRFVSSRCSTLGLPGPFLRNANCFGASWGCKDWVPWWDKPCRYLCVYVCRKFKLQQIPGEKITCILYIYIIWCWCIPIGSIYGIFAYIYHKNQPFIYT